MRDGIFKHLFSGSPIDGSCIDVEIDITTVDCFAYIE